MSRRPATPPTGVPDRIVFQGMFWSFDCIAGNGDAIYVREKEKSGERVHALVPRDGGHVRFES